MAILPPDDTSYGSRPHDRSDERPSRNDGEGTERTGSDRFAEASVQQAADLRRRRGRLKGALLGAAGLAVVVGGGGYLALRDSGDKNVPTAPSGRGGQNRTPNPTSPAAPEQAVDKFKPVQTFTFKSTAEMRFDSDGTPRMMVKPESGYNTKKVDNSGTVWELSAEAIGGEDLEPLGGDTFRGTGTKVFNRKGQPPLKYTFRADASTESANVTQTFTARLATE